MLRHHLFVKTAVKLRPCEERHSCIDINATRCTNRQVVASNAARILTQVGVLSRGRTQSH